MSGRVGSITTEIITDGLVFNMDAANRASTIPSSATTKTFNTIDTAVSGSFINDTIYDSSTITPSFAFDESGDYMDCGNNSSTNIAASNLTISFWVKSASNSQSNYTGLISKAPNTAAIVSAGQYEIEIQTSQNTRYIVTGCDLKAGSETTGTVPTLTLNTWENIAMTWDGDTIIAYKNATVTATKISPSATAPTSITEPLRIGKRENYGQFNGNIGPVQIYNRALSANEVLHNYNALKGRFGLS